MALKSAPHLSSISLSSDETVFGVDGGCADPYLPSVIPTKRWDYSTKWDMRVSGPVKEFDLAKQPLLQGLLNQIKSKTSLVHPEIHVVWRGLVPPSICRDDVVITCRFTPDRSEKMGLMAQHTHGMHLYMHHVFYPGHSIRVGPNEPLPWAIGFSIPDFSLDPKYVIGEVHVRLTGYFSQLPEYDIHKSSEMISIVPIDEPVTGFTTSAPRNPNEGWTLGGHKMGVDGKDTARRIKFLQEIGVDIEALKLVGQLNKTLKMVDIKALDGVKYPQIKAENAIRVNSHLRMIKK